MLERRRGALVSSRIILTRQRPNTTTPKIQKETHLSKQHKHFWGPPARWTCAGRWGWNYKQTNYIVRNPGCFRNGQKKKRPLGGVPGGYFDASVCLLKFPGPPGRWRRNAYFVRCLLCVQKSPTQIFEPYVRRGRIRIPAPRNQQGPHVPRNWLQ